jgi:Trk K+ transport system NAD-binding subunit
MAGSSYMFYYADEIINRLGRTFPDIQSDSVDEEQLADHYDVIVVGYGQHGQKLCHRLDASLQILVLEHDPRAVKHAVIPPNVTLIHADVTEDEIRRDVEQYSARYVIVTSSEPHVNISSHHYNKHLDRHIVGRANNEHDAIDLYESGIDIVHVIHDAAVDHTVQLINANPHPEQISTHTHSHLVELRTYTSEELFQSMSEKSG